MAHTNTAAPWRGNHGTDMAITRLDTNCGIGAEGGVVLWGVVLGRSRRGNNDMARTDLDVCDDGKPA